MFTEEEVAYLKTRPLARIATVSSNGQPDVAPVGYELDGHTFYIRGRRTTRTLKYKNVAAGQDRIALVIDDLASIDPWRPRGIKIHGRAETVEREGRLGHAPYLRITPLVYWSWGIEGPR